MSANVALVTRVKGALEGRTTGRNLSWHDHKEAGALAMFAGRVEILPGGQWPSLRDAEELARDLLGPEGTRLAHVRGAGLVAATLGVLFDDADAALLVLAATVHDIGYSPRIARTGFHPLDGARFLRAAGWPDRLAALVAHHSLAVMTAPAYGVHDLAEEFVREESLLADALVYADMHSAPDGQLIHVEQRLHDIARRHPGPVQVARAHQLRSAIARVTLALTASEHRDVHDTGEAWRSA